MAIVEVFGWVALAVVLVGGISHSIRLLFPPSATRPSSPGERTEFNERGGNRMAYCPRCGEPVNARDRFCRNCGERLEGGQPRSPQDKRVRCEFCKGTGEDPGSGDVIHGSCRVCRGERGRSVPAYWRPCRGECGGNGRIDISGVFDDFRPCQDCGGWGWADPGKSE